MENSGMSNLYGKGFAPQTTNNEMEVRAANELLKRLLYEDIGYENERITIWSDSKYCVYGFEVWRHKWAFEEFKRLGDKGKLELIPNANEWRTGHELIEKFKDVKFRWVRGHVGHYWNERVDAMAGSAMKAGRRNMAV